MLKDIVKDQRAVFHRCYKLLNSYWALLSGSAALRADGLLAFFAGVCLPAVFLDRRGAEVVCPSVFQAITVAEADVPLGLPPECVRELTMDAG